MGSGSEKSFTVTAVLRKGRDTGHATFVANWPNTSRPFLLVAWVGLSHRVSQNVMAAERDNVFATRMTLGVYKNKSKAAKKGHELLKRKADALKVRLRRMMNQIREIKLEIGEEVKMAHVSLARATYSYKTGDFKDRVIENAHTARTRVDAHVDNVAGVRLPIFELAATVEGNDGSEDLSQVYGLAGGGRKIAESADAFMKLVEKLVKPFGSICMCSRYQRHWSPSKLIVNYPLVLSNWHDLPQTLNS